MKFTAVFVTLLASAAAFVPASNQRASTALNESLFKKISNMDLWAPVSDSNEYGARNKKNLKQGQITGNSYVPAGLTAKQYSEIRAKEAAKKAANYQKNVKKAGIFQDYTDFYIQRGTDTSSAWAKSVTKGHEMAKTKYDWSGLSDKPLWASSGKKEAPKKKGFFGK